MMPSSPAQANIEGKEQAQEETGDHGGDQVG
jgi:hypothetical protein